MRVHNLFEANLSTNILVVDVQPAYDRWCGKIAPSVANLLNKHNGDKYCLFNAEGLTDDSQQSVAMYLSEQGMTEEAIDGTKFIEKGYGFFRAWMDQEVPERIIIKTIRAMVQNKVHDSRDLDVNKVLTPYEQERGLKLWKVDWENDGIYMPDFMPISILKRMSPFLMCGGAREHCLREIELLCNAFNIRYKRIDALIY